MTSLTTASSDDETFILAAAIEPLQSTDTSPRVGPYINLDASNPATYREQLATCNTYVSTSINKYARTLTKGIRFEGRSKAKKAIEDVAKKNNFIGQIQTAARYLVIHGDYIATSIGKGETFQAVPLLMSATTILPEGVTPNSFPSYILQPPINKFVINEGSKTSEVKQELLDPKDVIYCALNAFDAVQDDILQRKTRGLYGQSPLDPLKPAIRALLDVNEGQRVFYKKYGNGRYLYNMESLAEAVNAGRIKPEKAQEALNLFMERYKNLKANEDIVCYGMDVKALDANGTMNVMEFKSALETEIMIGLYQSPLTMGQSFQTTYASSYMVEEDRMMVLEGDQSILEATANQILNRMLLSMGLKEDSVTIYFDDLSKPKLDPSLLIELSNMGKITDDQLLEYLGFENLMPNEQPLDVKTVTTTQNKNNIIQNEPPQTGM